MNKLEKINRIKTKKPFRLADLIIVAALLILSVSLLIFIPKNKGAYIEVYVDNKLVLTHPLNSDMETKIYTGNGEHYNKIKIENGYVCITDADCSDKICIHTGKTNTKNKPIICLPHNLKIVINGADDDVDKVI